MIRTEEGDLSGLLAALRSDGRPGDAVLVSMLDAARALERYLQESAIGIVGPYLCLTRPQLVRLLSRAAGRTG